MRQNVGSTSGVFRNWTRGLTYWTYKGFLGDRNPPYAEFFKNFNRMYASPSWYGFTSAADRSKLERLVARLRPGGYLPADHPSFEGSTTISLRTFRLRHFVYRHFFYYSTVYQRTGQLYIQLLFQKITIFINSNFYLHYDSFLSIPLPLTL